MGHSFQNSSYFALQYNLHHAVINYGSAVLGPVKIYAQIYLQAPAE